MQEYEQRLAEQAAERFGNLPIKTFANRGNVWTVFGRAKTMREFVNRLDIPIGELIGYGLATLLVDDLADSKSFWNQFLNHAYRYVWSRARENARGARGQRKPVAHGA